MLIKIDSLCIGFENLHNETISRKNLYEISRNVLVLEKFTYRNNFAKFRERKYNEISRNFAKFRAIKITFVVISYFAK
jgi:hypothetical protein